MDTSEVDLHCESLPPLQCCAVGRICACVMESYLLGQIRFWQADGWVRLGSGRRSHTDSTPTCMSAAQSRMTDRSLIASPYSLFLQR